jgi:ribonuclease VapC
MAIDTSALIAILLSEPPAPRLVTILESTPSTHLSAASLVEAGIVMQGRLGDEGERRLDQLLFRLGVEGDAVSREYAEIARSALERAPLPLGISTQGAVVPFSWRAITTL